MTRPAGEGRHQLVAIRVTDESGLIQPISLPALSPSQSEGPENAQPFALCDVWMEHPEFQMLHVENVQVFPNVETRQNAEPLPLPEYPNQQDMTSMVDISTFFNSLEEPLFSVLENSGSSRLIFPLFV